MPPITSTTMSTSGRVASAYASAVSSDRSIPAARGCPTRRTAIPASSSRAPIRRARSSACSVSSRATWEPTEPQPSRAIFSVGTVGFTGESLIWHPGGAGWGAGGARTGWGAGGGGGGGGGGWGGGAGGGGGGGGGGGAGWGAGGARTGWGAGGARTGW